MFLLSLIAPDAANDLILLISSSDTHIWPQLFTTTHVKTQLHTENTFTFIFFK